MNLASAEWGLPLMVYFFTMIAIMARHEGQEKLVFT